MPRRKKENVTPTQDIASKNDVRTNLPTYEEYCASYHKYNGNDFGEKYKCTCGGAMCLIACSCAKKLNFTYYTYKCNKCGRVQMLTN